MRYYRYILFDLDGMLLDTSEGVYECVKYSLGSFGIEVTDDESLKPYMGPPLKYSFCRFHGLTPEQSEQALKLYREKYNSGGMYRCRMFDGVPELLAELKKRGHILGLATSKPERNAVLLMKHFGLDKYLDEITGASLDDSRSDKLSVVIEALRRFGNPDKRDVLLVGDRRYDTVGAHGAGISSFGVYMGCAEPGEHEEAGADYITVGIDGLSKALLESDPE